MTVKMRFDKVGVQLTIFHKKDDPRDGYMSVRLIADLNIDCRNCGLQFGFSESARNLQVDQGEDQEYQFRFPCPRCQTLIRFDQNEIELTVMATPDTNHP